MQLALTGKKGKNRYFDKVISLIVTKNGKAGINFEHSRIDATILREYVAGS